MADIKVKVFHASNSGGGDVTKGLQEKMDAWLEEAKPQEVISHRQSMTAAGNYGTIHSVVVTVFYR